MLMERELLLLGLLRQRRMHGYQLQEFINRDLEYCTDLKQSTAYNLLKGMSDKGWVMTTQEQEGNRPPRTVYEMTQDGEVIFQQLLRVNLANHTTMRLPDGIGLAFIDAIPPLEAAELLSKRRDAIEQQLSNLQHARQHGHDKGGLLLTLEHQEIHLNAELDWLTKVIEQLKEMG
jgi:DNA-binding PadR family transcriptional regulator